MYFQGTILSSTDRQKKESENEWGKAINIITWGFSYCMTKLESSLPYKIVRIQSNLTDATYLASYGMFSILQFQHHIRIPPLTLSSSEYYLTPGGFCQ